MTRDYGFEAQRAAEKHLENCMEALEAEESGREDSDELWPGNLAGPFCGCTTCVVREVLAAAWPILEEGLVDTIAEEAAKQLLELGKS